MFLMQIVPGALANQSLYC